MDQLHGKELAFAPSPGINGLLSQRRETTLAGISGAARNQSISARGMSFTKGLVSPNSKKKSNTLKNIIGTPLTAAETLQAHDLWDSLVNNSFLTSHYELMQLIQGLRVPVQPVIQMMLDEAFASSNKRFSFRNFTVLLEQCKSVHTKWLHKLRGKTLDDDLLEAFVAVGGHSDSSGQLDIDKMRLIVEEFHLNVDIDRIVRELDSDGDADIDFGEFASLIRESKEPKQTTATGKRLSRRRSLAVMPEVEDEEDTIDDFLSIEGLQGGVGEFSGPLKPITLSNTLYINEDDDRELLFPDEQQSSLTPHGVNPFQLQPTGRRMTDFTKKRIGEAQISPKNNNALKNVGTMEVSMMLPPLGRTQLRNSVAAGGAEGGATQQGSGSSFYKGGGGLRNMTPTPNNKSAKHHESPDRSQTSMSHGGKSPAKGVAAREPKKHKFAN